METFIAELKNGDIDANGALDKLKEIMRGQQRSAALRVSCFWFTIQEICLL